MLKEGGKADSRELDMMLVGPKWIRLGWFVALFYIVELWLLKGAFIAFYWGLFSKVHTRLRFLLYSTIFLVVTTFLILIILYLSWCTPIERNWTAPIIEHRKCGFNPSRTAQTIQTAFNISTDLLIMLIPLSILNSLRLGTHEKFALAFVFTIGGFIVVASGIRYGIVMKSLSQNYNLQTIRDMERWSVVECTMALLAFCLPALRRLVVRVFGAGRRMGSGERESEGRVGGSGGYAKGNWFDATAVGKVYSVEATRVEPEGRKGSEEAIELRAKTTRGPGESQEWLRSV
ncbi:hypothetical protein EX30DRAFT_266093 [Ascodesmis nigricans]|uniref:Rhodopsin domain-containing protein n=1 Tax=Ascodesmis nigricans TaxID=341454 RepID=A0A4V3SHH8_9PEZI|nr:hypothetical protein EX30DRAFT_266093 [Ascodesmis nigricans]